MLALAEQVGSVLHFKWPVIDNLLQIVLEEQKTQFNHDFHTSCEPKLSFGISTSTISPCSKT